MEVGHQPPSNVAGFDPVATAGDCVYDCEAANKAVRFFELGLVHTKGKWAGQPFKLEEWQRDFVRTLFGWRRMDATRRELVRVDEAGVEHYRDVPAMGSRRFRTTFLFLPRKNGKSQLAAAICNYVLLCDGEPEAECYCAASDKDQATLVFKASASMLRKNEMFSSRVKIRDSLRRTIYKDSFLRAIPANEGGSHGFNAHLIVGDELHTWPNRDFYDTLHTSTGAREQPLEVYITTAGHDKLSICYEVYNRARQVRDGVIEDESFLPVIYEAEETDDWQSEATWRKANPNLGVSVRLDYIAAECQKAKENPAYENTFRRLHLNQWTSQETRFIQMHHWDQCPATPEPIELGTAIVGGLDLSSTIDFTAWVKAKRLENGIVKLWGHYFLPRPRVDILQRTYNIPIEVWARDGWVTITEDARIDYRQIKRQILADDEAYSIQAIGYDPHNATELCSSLDEDHGVPMVEFRQGMLSLSPPTKVLESLVATHKLDHSGDPVLRWMADNVMVKPDESENVRPVKNSKTVGKRHIDGIVAAIMAIGQLGEESELVYKAGDMFS